jgi:hypothetical protein
VPQKLEGVADVAAPATPAHYQVRLEHAARIVLAPVHVLDEEGLLEDLLVCDLSALGLHELVLQGLVQGNQAVIVTLLITRWDHILIGVGRAAAHNVKRTLGEHIFQEFAALAIVGLLFDGQSDLDYIF